MQPTSPTAAGIAVQTTIRAGYIERQHAEGIVVRTAVTAGGSHSQHAEGIVVRTR